MSGRTAGATLRAHRVPPAVGLVVALAVVPLTAGADECQPGHVCLSEPAVRRCDADQAQLAHVLAELRATEQALVVATGDAATLSRALDDSSRLVLVLREEVRAARPWLPGWGYVLVGAVLGVAASVVLALSL